MRSLDFGLIEVAITPVSRIAVALDLGDEVSCRWRDVGCL
ncbi:hypothetical protein SynBIOSE41_01059 [Synechococcus sp. BIOS-E4-1]|nr:hypothetical protein SynBIOSE41_01059 [Synechococcus sp. BIOS-E4-1]